EAMLPWLSGPEAMGFANPHSPHRAGRAAAAAVAVAREQGAALLPSGGKVIFTSCATEALNLAILGRNPKQIAVSTIEHAAVLDTAQASGARFHMLETDRDGLVATTTAIPTGTDL